MIPFAGSGYFYDLFLKNFGETYLETSATIPLSLKASVRSFYYSLKFNSRLCYYKNEKNLEIINEVKFYFFKDH